MEYNLTSFETSTEDYFRPTFV